MNVAPVETGPRETLLPTAWVTATSNGVRMRVRALLDQASQVCIVTQRIAQRMCMQRSMSEMPEITGVGRISVGKKLGGVQFEVMASDAPSFEVNAMVLPSITAMLPNIPVQASQHPAFAALKLADETYWKPGRIDLLIGAAKFSKFLLKGLHKADGLVAQDTTFGWIMSGEAVANMHTTAALTCTMHVQLEDVLKRFWEQEETEPKQLLSHDDVTCEQMYASTTTRAADGRYIVELPFRQGGRELGESRTNAVRRLLQMERRGRQYPLMYNEYRSFMRNYLELGHMEIVPQNEVDNDQSYYLPHHAVFKPESTTTKLRVVFDATAASSNGVGLNSLLHTGPRLQETLPSILMRWRTRKIAISADVQKMYRQIWVHPSHRDYQRIVWREKEEEPMAHYRLKTVTYGVASAPYMAIKTLQRLGEDESKKFPLGAKVLQTDFYVDDCLTGSDTFNDAIQLKDELIGVMNAGGMKLLKWSSNSVELLQTLPADHLECQAPLMLDNEQECVKALGIRWYPSIDVFGYKVTVPKRKEKMTKREILGEIARLFDPLGLVAPVVVTAKIIMQQLWLTGLNWDDELPQDTSELWHSYQSELTQLEELRIPRWCGTTSNNVLQLHGFSDASQVAYSACVYSRVQDEHGKVIVSLLAAKTKVAPIKQQSIPRLELCGAVLVTRLLLECRQAFKQHHVELFAWTDSTVVLAWLQRHANVWQTYVANRVSEIQSSMTSRQWRHVAGVENPADCASRGLMPSEIRDHQLWWTGPTWLADPETTWPQRQPADIDETQLEQRKPGLTCNVVMVVNEMFILAERCSSLAKLLRVTAYCRRVLRRNRRDGQVLAADEIEEARRVWIRLAQQQEFGTPNSNMDTQALEAWARSHTLSKLKPFIDESGIVRVGGRLQNAVVAYEERHPAILPARNVFTRLVILDAHERVFHAGSQNTMGRLHQRYWLLKERNQVRALIHKCVTCARARPHAQAQLMGSLPLGRVRPTRPFTHTAIDYAGPIRTRTSKGRGIKATKAWVAVFVCLCTKAVHLELVSDISAAAFRAAFRRFTSRRGACSDVYSDNGTNFVGADREMREQLARCLQDENWRSELSDGGTRFHFAPPGSPHFNGLAEATVKMAKSAMRRIIGEHTLTFEEMITFLSQVEAALNSRPLCALPAEGDEASVLTPGHFLVGQPLTAVPEPNAIDEKLTLSNRWHLIQQMVQHFWRRWSQEYLHQLQQRSKWTATSPNVTVGDVVLLHDELQHVTRWRMGRVIETHIGKDGLVRVATIKTAGGTLKRAVTKMTILPVNDKMYE